MLSTATADHAVTSAPEKSASLHADSSATPPVATPKAVVVHGGARDAYQLAIALSEANMLESLVTDLFWPADRAWAQRLSHVLPQRWRRLLRQRSTDGLPFSQVTLSPWSGALSLTLDRLRRAPFSMRRKAIRMADAQLGRRAGLRAVQSGAALVSYSYFGFHAFQEYKRPAILFQVHPHPATVRRILQQELEAHPECAPSLKQEWELSLPEHDFQRLVDETRMAARFLVSSSFTRNSLIEHGTPASSIAVVPYGVDLQRFRPAMKRTGSTLRLLFVGRINQRKGVKYLLQALRLLHGKDVELTICGRVVDDLDLFRGDRPRIHIRPSVSLDELVAAYQSADLFVFPSVAEGFGLVLLEALACGLPILSTTHTAAPDLIEDGVQGFVVEPRRPDLLADRIDWALRNRSELLAMGRRARHRAEQYTWQAFRTRAAEAVARFLAEPEFRNTGAR